MQNAASISSALNGKQQGAGFIALCPAHHDHKPSLSISDRDGKTLVKCHAGCSQTDVIRALTERGLWPKKDAQTAKRELVATYPYTDANGSTIYEIMRFKPKTFRARQRRSDGHWVFNLAGVDPLPFRLPSVQKAIASGETIYIVEGEKDVTTLEAVGLTATCNHGGATKWRDAHSKYLVGAKVVVLPDNDQAGRDHARIVCASLLKITKDVRVLELPNQNAKEDVSDWIAKGHGAADLTKLLHQNSIPANEYLAVIDIESGGIRAEERPTITCANGEMPRSIRQIEDALLKGHAEIFERGTLLVKTG